jgi:hypothetical protein
MNHPVEVLLYLAIASFALLPAVYAVALDASSHYMTTLQVKESMLTAQATKLTSERNELDSRHQSKDRERLARLEVELRNYRRRIKQLRSPSVHLSPKRALLYPALAWGITILFGSLSKFSGASAQLKGVAFIVSLAALVPGYYQLYLTLNTASKAIEEGKPSLNIIIEGPYETQESKEGKSEFTMEYAVIVQNDSARTARSTQIAIETPDRGIYFPVLRPKKVLRNGTHSNIAYTPGFDLKPQEFYKQFVKLAPMAFGNYILVFTPVCDDWIGDSQTITFVPDRLRERRSRA